MYVCIPYIASFVLLFFFLSRFFRLCNNKMIMPVVIDQSLCTTSYAYILDGLYHVSFLIFLWKRWAVTVM